MKYTDRLSLDNVKTPPATLGRLAEIALMLPKVMNETPIEKLCEYLPRLEEILALARDIKPDTTNGIPEWIKVFLPAEKRYLLKEKRFTDAWNEGEHTRGKTTSKSNSGSFSPQANSKAQYAQANPKHLPIPSIPPIPSTTNKSGQDNRTEKQKYRDKLKKKLADLTYLYNSKQGQCVAYTADSPEKRKCDAESGELRKKIIEIEKELKRLE
ncbi:MAG: hypothetical protein LBH05_02780 [Deferribacteraceae bacterium]|jgi:hypothetical protein|nr:hypothetical protein [Deferribacteraceae bacterium]